MVLVLSSQFTPTFAGDMIPNRATCEVFSFGLPIIMVIYF